MHADWNYPGRIFERSPEEQSLLKELYSYARSGCRICLDGRPCRPEGIANACLRDDRLYMRDFKEDSDQRICEINFIRIRRR